MKTILAVTMTLFGTPLAFGAEGDNIQNLAFRSGYPLISCSFDGLKSNSGCVLDTGSPVTIIPKSLNGKVHGNAGETMELLVAIGRLLCKSIRISQLDFGGHLSAGVEVLRCSGAEQLFGNQGSVGVNVLEHGTWMFDMPHGAFIAESEIPTGLTLSDLKRDDVGTPVVSLSIEDQTINAGFDTGSPDTYVDVTIFRLHRDKFRFAKRKLIGGTWQVDMYEMSQLTAAGKSLLAREVVVMDFDKQPLFKKLKELGQPILLGTNVIRNYIWHMDFNNNLWALDEVPDRRAPPHVLKKPTPP